MRCVHKLSTVCGGGPIARSFFTALRLPRRCASAIAKAYEADSPAGQSPICPLPMYAATFSGKRAA
jgi:hypothetical protein